MLHSGVCSSDAMCDSIRVARWHRWKVLLIRGSDSTVIRRCVQPRTHCRFNILRLVRDGCIYHTFVNILRGFYASAASQFIGLFANGPWGPHPLKVPS
ncbi:uncharacterized protein B0H18DRAFT_995452 [Fomitopsis serialis]|uniref:uncharacterized protein n=1 Tax=Fomitopsis serialis TaxID=139415 RepID=UPI0020072899|nr:uncharacterized protein B0H18DRAFT_995452 [Neoantrodia serialis]KAH9930151.1 hypothetical protein B0H18DRAFT_995452 [Neoantrodia serialis]